MIDWINELAKTYYPIISTAFGLLAAAYTMIRMCIRFRDDYKDRESRLVGIEKRLHHLDNNKDGRVNKLSTLCESQIESNKTALAASAYNTGRIDQLKKN